jgi:type II secretion system protein G
MNRRGFTLIELLVVISIIGLLSSIVLASIKDARQRAEIAKFKEEMISLRNALELYKSDHGDYPNGSNILVKTLTSSVLSSYLKTTITVPSALKTPDEKFLYYKNTINNSCGDTKSSEGYFIFFDVVASSLISSNFPILYNAADTPSGLYCAFIAPK